MGNVLERYKYDGFGRRTVLSADAVVEKTSSEYNWNRAFTGQVLDSETGLMLYRNRYYHTGFGRWTSRDPIGYEAGDGNLFRMVNNNTINYTDFIGYAKCPDDSWSYYGGSGGLGLIAGYSRADVTLACMRTYVENTARYVCQNCVTVDIPIEQRAKAKAVITTFSLGLQAQADISGAFGGRIHGVDSTDKLNLGSQGVAGGLSIGLVVNVGVQWEPVVGKAKGGLMSSNMVGHG
jgi:RHS repeat-associated protein